MCQSLHIDEKNEVNKAGKKQKSPKHIVSMVWPWILPPDPFWAMLCCAQSCLTLCNPMDCSLQAPYSMEFSRQEYWSGLPYPSPGDLSNLGIKPGSLASPALEGSFFNHWATCEALSQSNPWWSHLLPNFISQAIPSCELQMHIQLPACFTLGASECSDSACQQSDCQDLL